MTDSIQPLRFTLRDGRLLADRSTLRAPLAGDVVIANHAMALGRAPEGSTVGTVVAVGEGAADWLGRPVLVPALLPCGDCVYCRRGRVSHCAAQVARAGLATHETIPARFLCALDGALAFSVEEQWPLAALSADGALAYSAVCRAGVAPGSVALITGGGLWGALTLALLRAVGAEAVVLDDDPRRRARALEQGALRTMTIAEAVALGTSGLLAALGDDHVSKGDPVEPVFVTEGHLPMSLVPPGASVLLLGNSADSPSMIEASAITAHEWSVLGVSGCHPDLLVELAALVRRGALPLSGLAQPFDIALADGESVALPDDAAADAVDRLLILRLPR